MPTTNLIEGGEHHAEAFGEGTGVEFPERKLNRVQAGLHRRGVGA